MGATKRPFVLDLGHPIKPDLRKRGHGSTDQSQKRGERKVNLCTFRSGVTKLPSTDSVYSSGWMNCRPKRRKSPAMFCRSTRARMGGVSLGTRLLEAGEGAGMVKCTV